MAYKRYKKYSRLPRKDGGGALEKIGEVAGAIPVIGGVIQGLTSLFGGDPAEEERKQLELQRQRAAVEEITNNSRATLSTYPTYGTDGGYAYGGRYGKYKNGNPEPTNQGTKRSLSSDMSVYDGPSHENSGIPVDTNNDNSPDIEIEGNEVVKDNQVYSDRLKPSKDIFDLLNNSGVKISDKDTFANIAERIGKKKGKLEKAAESNDPLTMKTTNVMLSRLDQLAESMFMDQQEQNNDGKDNEGEFKNGGIYIKPENRGKFTRWAKAHGMSVSQAASHVMANKDKYSSGVVKMANFAKNFGGKRGLGGELEDDDILDPKKVKEELDAKTKAKAHPRAEIDELLRKNYPGMDLGLLDSTNKSVVPGVPDNHDIYVLRKSYHPTLTGGAKYINGPMLGPDGRPLDQETTVMNKRGFGGSLSFRKPRLHGYARYSGGRNPHDPNYSAYSIPTSVILQNDLMLQHSYSAPSIPSSVTKKAFGGHIPSSDIIEPDGVIKQSLLAKAKFGKDITDLIKGTGQFLGDNIGDVAAVVGTLGNQAAIDRMETNVPARQVAKQPFSYINRSYGALNNNNRQYRTLTGSLKRSGNLTSGAQASAFAEKLNADNQVMSDEATRRQGALDQYSARNLQTDYMNSYYGQQADYNNNIRYNQKIGLGVQNANNLIQSLIGNKTQRDLQGLDMDKLLITLGMDGNRGISQRMMDDPVLGPVLQRYSKYRKPKKAITNETTVPSYGSNFNPDLTEPY